jgi:hypothetical protein
MLERLDCSGLLLSQFPVGKTVKGPTDRQQRALSCGDSPTDQAIVDRIRGAVEPVVRLDD